MNSSQSKPLYARPRQMKRPINNVSNPSVQPIPPSSSPLFNTRPIIERHIEELLTEFQFFTNSDRRKNIYRTSLTQIKNSLYDIHEEYNSMYFLPYPSSNFLERYEQFRKSLKITIENIGRFVRELKIVTPVNITGSSLGTGYNGNFKLIRNKGYYKVVRSSDYLLTGKIFIEFFIHKYLNKIQRDNEGEIQSRLGYLPIPSTERLNRFTTNNFGLKINRIEGKSLDLYLKEDFVHLSEEKKLLKLKDILHKLSNILMIFQEKISFTHGDLTPSNIMINESGNIYLIDFRKSLIIPNNRIYTSETMCLLSFNIDTMKLTLKSIDISLLYFTLIQHYYMFLGERCMQFLVDILLGNGLYESLCIWFKEILRKEIG